jgi:hypothetical protein
MYDGGFIKGKKIKMKNWIFHPNREGGGDGGINRVSDSVLFLFFALAGESTFSERGIARRFPGYGFSCISSLFPSLHSVLVSFSGEGFFGLCVHVLGLQFPKGFSRLHFVRAFFFSFSKGFSARFLQRGSSTFPSVRFQLASFLPARFCVCVCWFCNVRGDFFGAAFPAYFLRARFFPFVWFCDFRGSFWGPAFPAYFLQQVPQLVFQ